MQPANNPLENLAALVDRIKSTEAGDNFRKIARDQPQALKRQLESALTDDPKQGCLILIDQFEELFTQVKNGAEQAIFINQLTTAAVENSRIKIVIALRSDFLTEVARFPQLRQLINQQFHLVGSMGASDLAKAIILPALEVGADIEADLVTQVIHDMYGAPDALPLMSFALRDLFEAQFPKKGESVNLTKVSYIERGGISDALVRHADRVYQKLSLKQRELAKNIFSKLIEVGQGRGDSRRTATFGELIPIGQSVAEIEAVVNQLAEEHVRLLVTHGPTIDNLPSDSLYDRRVTISHERLIDAWPWLQTLVNENRELIALQNQIGSESRVWNLSMDNGDLLRGGRLLNVKERYEELKTELDALSIQFIQASIDFRDKENAEKAAQQGALLTAQKLRAEEAEKRSRAEELARAEAENAQHQAEADAIRVRSRNRFVFGLAILGLVLAAFSFYFFQDSQSNLNDANIKGTEAANNLQTAIISQEDAANNLLTATYSQGQEEIAKEAALVESTRALNAESTANAGATTSANNLETAIIAQGEAANNLLTATYSQGQEEIAKEAALVESTRALNAESTANAGATQVANSLMTATVARGNAEENAILAEARASINFSQALAAEAGQLTNLSSQIDLLLAIESNLFRGEKNFATNASYVALHKLIPRFPIMKADLAHSGSVWESKWNADESLILTNSADGTVKVWQADSWTLLLELPHNRSVNDAKWNANESLILTSSGVSLGSDGAAYVWDAKTGRLILTLPHERKVHEAKWNSDESLILTISEDRTARVWDAESGEQLFILLHEGNVHKATWSSDERLILTNSGTLRGGAAQLWDSRSGNLLHTLHHRFPVTLAKWNAEENLILTVENGLSGTVRIWPLDSEVPLHSFSHDGEVIDAIWNSDESLILTFNHKDALNDESIASVRIWDTESGDLFREFLHDDDVNDAKWSLDEKYILSSSNDRTVKIWHVDSGDLLHTFVHNGRVNQASWNSDESLILTSSIDDGTANVWHVDSGALLSSFSHDEPVDEAKWNADESLILTNTTDPFPLGEDDQGSARVWQASSRPFLETLSFDGELIVAWNSDRSLILTQNVDKTIKVWDPYKKNILLVLPHDENVKKAKWNPDETLILTVGDGGTVKIWDAEGGDLLTNLAHPNEISDARWNADESLLLTFSSSVVSTDVGIGVGIVGDVTIWDVETEETFQTISYGEGGVMGAIWNSDESLILTNLFGFETTANLWDIQSNTHILTLPHEDAVHHAQWNADESLILTISGSPIVRYGSVDVWQSDSGRHLYDLPHDGYVYEANWNSDESLILTSNGDALVRDGEAQIWDAETGSLLHTFSHDGAVYETKWNLDESLILTRSEDGTAKLWEATSEIALHTFFHESAVSITQWNSDESLILTGSFDGTAKVWDANTGQLKITMEGDGSAILAARWVNDGAEIEVETYNGRVFRYLTDIRYARELACERAPRNFTWQEWQQFAINEPYRKTCQNRPVHCSVPLDQWPKEHIDEQALCPIDG